MQSKLRMLLVVFAQSQRLDHRSGLGMVVRFSIGRENA